MSSMNASLTKVPIASAKWICSHVNAQGGFLLIGKRIRSCFSKIVIRSPPQPHENLFTEDAENKRLIELLLAFDEYACGFAMNGILTRSCTSTIPTICAKCRKWSTNQAKQIWPPRIQVIANSSIRWISQLPCGRCASLEIPQMSSLLHWAGLILWTSSLLHSKAISLPKSFWSTWKEVGDSCFHESRIKAHPFGIAMEYSC